MTEVDDRTETGSKFAAEIIGGQCRIRESRFNNRVQRRTRVSYQQETADRTITDYYWVYRPVEYDVSVLKGNRADGLMAGGQLSAPISNDRTLVTATWAGCIEERDTVRSNNYNPIPADAIDLDIDQEPTAGRWQTQWRPHIPELVYVRRSTSSWSVSSIRTTDWNYPRATGIQPGLIATCPSRARKLAPMSSGEISNYLSGLQTGGYTYLDIGMLWAGRLLSPTGLFRTENAGGAGSTSVSRHLVFMTDGTIRTDVRNYDAYGLAALDRRRTDLGTVPTQAQLDQIVTNRFDALCTAVKAKGITIWTVAFGTALTTQLQNCASGSDRAFSAQNSQQLNQAFEDIAAKIAQLRLTE